MAVGVGEAAAVEVTVGAGLGEAGAGGWVAVAAGSVACAVGGITVGVDGAEASVVCTQPATKRRARLRRPEQKGREERDMGAILVEIRGGENP